MNMARYELIGEFENGDCIEYEDPWGYHILMYKGKELTTGLKCIDCRYVSIEEWYWRDSQGFWHSSDHEPAKNGLEHYIASGKVHSTAFRGLVAN